MIQTFAPRLIRPLGPEALVQSAVREKIPEDSHGQGIVVQICMHQYILVGKKLPV